VHDLAQDSHGRKVLYYLLCARHPLYFHPDIIKVLQQGDGNTIRWVGVTAAGGKT